MENIAPNTLKDQRELLVRLDRNNRRVQHLAKKLNSYTYEPKCPQGFEKYYELKESIKRFTIHQNKIMAKIGADKPNIDEIAIHLERFKKLESEFAAYIFDLKKPL